MIGQLPSGIQVRGRTIGQDDHDLIGAAQEIIKASARRGPSSGGIGPVDCLGGDSLVGEGQQGGPAVRGRQSQRSPAGQGSSPFGRQPPGENGRYRHG